MLNIKPPDYKYCPFCSSKLSIKIEEGVKRKCCKKDNWTYFPHVVASVAAVIKKRNKVLMVKRNRNPYKNTWMFPAGFIDFGEHPGETLVREVKEEAGLKVKEFNLLKIIQSTDDPRAPGHFIFFYEVRAEGNTKNLDKDENSDIDWFETKNPPKIGWTQHKEILKDLQQQ